MVKWSAAEKKRAVRLFVYQTVLWILADVFLIHDWIVMRIPSNAMLSYVLVIAGELLLTVLSVYTDIRFGRYVNQKRDRFSE